jgi:uncharacterized protein (TIGR00251 family)
VRFEVRVVPRAERDRIVGVVDGTLSIRVTAPPVDDAANRAVVRMLGAALGVAPSRVAISAGATARRKTIEVSEIAPGVLEARWPDLVVFAR